MRYLKALLVFILVIPAMIFSASLGGLGMLLCFSLGAACCATIIGIPVGIVLFGIGIGLPFGCGLGALIGMVGSVLEDFGMKQGVPKKAV